MWVKVKSFERSRGFFDKVTNPWNRHAGDIPNNNCYACDVNLFIDELSSINEREQKEEILKGSLTIRSMCKAWRDFRFLPESHVV